MTMKKVPSTRSAVTIPTMFWWSRAARSRGSWRRSSKSPLCRWGTLIATFLSIQMSFARKTVPNPPEPRLERIWYFPTVCPSRNMKRGEHSLSHVPPQRRGHHHPRHRRGFRAEHAWPEADRVEAGGGDRGHLGRFPPTRGTHEHQRGPRRLRYRGQRPLA